MILSLILDTSREITCQAVEVPWFHLPVGIFSVLTGLAAAAMAIRENSSWYWRGVWLFIIFALTACELRMIVWSDADASRERAYASCQMEQSFQRISTENQTEFQATAHSVGSVLTTTQNVADLSKSTLANITGGDSYIYVLPDTGVANNKASGWGEAFSLTARNGGSQLLFGVQVYVTEFLSEGDSTGRVALADGGTNSPIQIGSIAPHGYAKVTDKYIYPKLDAKGEDHWRILTTAQNGVTKEEIYFRRAADGIGWAYKYSLMTHNSKGTRILPPQNWTEPVKLRVQ